VTGVRQIESGQPHQARVCAIVVTFFPDRDLGDRLRLAGDQVEILIVVDNSADRSTLLQLEQLRSDRVHLIFQERNVGLACALNAGLRWARAAGFQWALLLDQDTTLLQNAAEELLSIVADYPHPDSIAAVGSSYNQATSAQCQWTEETSVITSGTLVSLTALEKIGPFREDFFVDCVDLEYCLRARARGFAILRSSKKLMEHQIGNVTVHKIFGFRAGTSNHTVVRRYYLARNLTALIREYRYREPAWAARMILNQLKSMILLGLFEENRWRKLKSYLLGVYDGINGWFGRDLAEWEMQAVNSRSIDCHTEAGR